MSVAGEALIQSDLGGLTLHSRGKVRDIYDVGDELLIVTTDRISAFDVVLPVGIPDKGRVLNQLSLFWFDRTQDIVRNHVLSAAPGDAIEPLERYREELDKRSMLVRKLRPVSFECVVRGYLYGSGWREYQERGSVCGILLPTGMRQAERFPEPLFTPATKADSGHDENVRESFMADRIGEELTRRLRELSLELYRIGCEHAESKGILIADTKFEFGRDDRGELYLIDEVLTPDSSRFWPREDYEPGREQPSYDKQFVREYLDTLEWDKTPPGPELPPRIIDGTRERYLSAYRAITGRTDL